MVVNMAASLRQRLAKRSKRPNTWASGNSKRGAEGPEAGLSLVDLQALKCVGIKLQQAAGVYSACKASCLVASMARAAGWVVVGQSN